MLPQKECKQAILGKCDVHFKKKRGRPVEQGKALWALTGGSLVKQLQITVRVVLHPNRVENLPLRSAAILIAIKLRTGSGTKIENLNNSTMVALECLR